MGEVNGKFSDPALIVNANGFTRVRVAERGGNVALVNSEFRTGSGDVWA